MEQNRKPWKQRVLDFCRNNKTVDSGSILTVLKREAEKKHHLLQIGALDFVSFDPLVEFINIDEWMIDFVEPQLYYANLLRSRYAEFKNIRVHELCVAETSGSRIFYYVDHAAIVDKLVPEWAAGIASLHLDKNALGGLGCGQADYEMIKRHIRSTEVECMRMEEFMLRFSDDLPTIIWVDIEGEDSSVVKHFDFNLCLPSIFRIEGINMNDEDVNFSICKFSEHGYTVGFFDNDIIAIRKDLMQS